MDDQPVIDRLYSEVRLLKTLKHKNIIALYSVWRDENRNTLNFITEVCTSGNLREYRNKHKHVSMKALKKWSKQILKGLEYLHTHEPCVIHRDLNCSNVFINGNIGQVYYWSSCFICYSIMFYRACGLSQYVDVVALYVTLSCFIEQRVYWKQSLVVALSVILSCFIEHVIYHNMLLSLLYMSLYHVFSSIVALSVIYHVLSSINTLLLLLLYMLFYHVFSSRGSIGNSF